jgi:hypothetical protein
MIVRDVEHGICLLYFVPNRNHGQAFLTVIQMTMTVLVPVPVFLFVAAHVLACIATSQSHPPSFA